MLTLQKIIASFVSVPGIFLVIVAVLLVVYRKKLPRSFSWIAWTLFIGCYCLTTHIGVRWIVQPLEERYPPVVIQDIQADQGVIVVLGGGVTRGVPSFFANGPDEEIGVFTLRRLLGGYQLYQHSGMDIYLSGGVLEPGSGRAESSVMKQVLMDWGVPEKDIIVEPDSRTTMENASFVIDNLPSDIERIYLVTSAVHMARSVMSYQKVVDRSARKIEIIPVPSGYVMDRGPWYWYHFLPGIGNLQALASAVHEYVGIIFYAFR